VLRNQEEEKGREAKEERKGIEIQL